jgi:organic hydroperoxide reductase OsmC/OhrA
MTEHRARITWTRNTPDFTYDSYDRGHEWRFPGGVTVPASSSPEFRGRPERVNPEEAFVAALSSCHLLSFLAIAARRRLTVDGYSDDAVGHMSKNPQGRLAVTSVILRPHVTWASGTAVSREDLDKLHHLSHQECFIANSVKTDVSVEPQYDV